MSIIVAPPTAVLAMLACLVSVFCGCAPAVGPPKVVLDRPAHLPDQWNAKKLYHTPSAYIYALSPDAAGETDRWLIELQKYISRKHGRELDKGVVLVMEPRDEPIAPTLDEQCQLELDACPQHVAPRTRKSVAELRKQFQEIGLPESQALRAASLAIPPAKRSSLGLAVPGDPWVVAVPSHALAAQVGASSVASMLRKRNPRVTQQQAEDAANRAADLAAKPFELCRANPVFVAWAVRQADWSPEQRREAIVGYLKHVLRSNWMPVPDEEELSW
jgi:hypothetical protein